VNNFKIVSGGQTGVDRGALDAALELNIPCGGWCPEGRKAEDGVIPEQYPLEEMKDADYRDRTRQNVLDSDASAIIYFGEIEGGTEQTLDDCVQNGRPYQLIDGSEMQPGQAAKVLADFVRQRGAVVLNVAGPRASKNPRGHRYAQDTVRLLVEALRQKAPASGKRHDGGRAQGAAQGPRRGQAGRGGGRPEGQQRPPQQGQPGGGGGGGGKRGKNRGGRSRNPNAGQGGNGAPGGPNSAPGGGNPQANNQRRKALGQHYRAKHGVDKQGE
jgi:hypothetical protein